MVARDLSQSKLNLSSSRLLQPRPLRPWAPSADYAGFVAVPPQTSTKTATLLQKFTQGLGVHKKLLHRPHAQTVWTKIFIEKKRRLNK